MKKQTGTVATLFVGALIGAFNVLGQVSKDEISKYRSWSKVTPRPHPVELTSVDGASD